MKTIGNILWFILVGLWSLIGWMAYAVLLGITVIGLPFARQCVKLARFSAWPFGREAVHSPDAPKLGAVGQVVWVLLAGWWLALCYVISGAILCITVIGVPFGKQAFKLAGLAFAPFGKEITTKRHLKKVEAAAR